MSRLASPWQRIVVLERIARGAGATRFHLAKDCAGLERTFASLRAGSRVTLYFQGPMRVEPLHQAVIGEMFAAVRVKDEIVIACPEDGEGALHAEFVSGPSELTECLMRPTPTGDVVWGPSRERTSRTPSRSFWWMQTESCGHTHIESARIGTRSAAEADVASALVFCGD